METATLAFGIYKRIFGVSMNVNSLIDNIKLQKIVYLLYELGAPFEEISFSWNKYGPFSPNLQFIVKNATANPEEEMKFNKWTEEKIIEVEELLSKPAEGNVSYSETKWAELLGSMHYLKKYIHPTYSKEETLGELNKYKPYLNDWSANEIAWDKLVKSTLSTSWVSR